MRVFASPRHRRHDPEREIESSGFQTPFEHPGRAETIAAAVAADQRFVVGEPPEWDTGPIEASVRDTAAPDSAIMNGRRPAHPTKLSAS